jgi:adenosylmethionine-8-amino-7-oxononanoate aminotransferase
VALANLEILEREHLLVAAAEKGTKLLSALQPLTSLEHVGEVRGLGLMCGIEFVEDKATKKPFDPKVGMAARVLKACVARGLVSRYRGDIFCVAPPFVTTDAELERMVNIIGEAISAARS